jgi:hypothetical protein
LLYMGNEGHVGPNVVQYLFRVNESTKILYSRSLIACSRVVLEKASPFIEIKSPLLRSQQLAAGSFSEPVESSHNISYCISFRTDLIILSYGLCPQSGLFS